MRIFIFGLLFSMSALAFQVPSFNPNVVDTSGALSDEAILNLNNTISLVQQSTIVRPAVLVVNTLQDSSIEDAAEKTFTQWGLGEKGKDNGLLIIVAIQDRQMRIEVGYGLEGELTDYFCAQVIALFMKPQFRAGKFEEGIALALNEVMVKMKGSSTLPSTMPSTMPLLTESIEFDRGWYAALIWVGCFFFLPSLFQTVGLIVAGLLQTKAFKLFRQKNKTSLLTFMLGAASKQTLFLKLFLLVNPGIFFVVFPIVFSEEVALVFGFYFGAVLFMGLALYFSVQNVRMLFSEKLMRRQEAGRRLRAHRSKQTPGSTYTMFGKTYTAPTRSSSSGGGSSRSSSSFSSSSGGGRSGGGGASGSW